MAACHCPDMTSWFVGYYGKLQEKKRQICPYDWATEKVLADFDLNKHICCRL